jgi:hypothetical protein
MTTIMSSRTGDFFQRVRNYYRTQIEPGEFTEGQKRYKNKLMSIRLEPFAKVVTKNGNS